MRFLISLFLVLLAGNASGQGIDLFTTPGTESTGEAELKAFAAVYPDVIGAVEIRDGDWAIPVDGEWFYWAHGRILPQAERANWETYARFRFYNYPLGGLPPLPNLDAASSARLKKLQADSRTNPPHRSEAFLERLLKAGTRTATQQSIVSVSFLGFHVQVHELIADLLVQVARDCEAAAASDPQVAAFLSGLSQVDGFSYRDVAGTLSRSYHSYGLAVDLIPKSYAGKATYWRWIMDTNDRWWATPYGERWTVPQPVVAAFERHGFVWGGKWLFFDTMHFEYRPEILLMAHAGQ